MSKQGYFNVKMLTNENDKPLIDNWYVKTKLVTYHPYYSDNIVCILIHYFLLYLKLF